jgi:hypothetical protein
MPLRRLVGNDVQLIEWARPELSFLEHRPQEMGMARLEARPRAFGDAMFAHSADPAILPLRV